MLDHLFSHFDTLAERYGLEKIKTIGDCYMVAAGCPDAAARSRPGARAHGARHARGDARRATRSATSAWSCASGINSGPVVAGVIGRKRFLYDLWGDAVNTASRMESHGTPGRIQITRATYELLEDEFVCEPRGTITVKGKGEMEVWYLVGRRATRTASSRGSTTRTPSTRSPPGRARCSRSTRRSADVLHLHHLTPIYEAAAPRRAARCRSSATCTAPSC